MNAFTEPLEKLMEVLKRLPGIGPRSAQRIAFYLLQCEEDYIRTLLQTVSDARFTIRLCGQCNNYTNADLCEICSDPRRDRTTICVVERPFEIAAIEKSRHYRGLYHVLHGALSPINGIGPDELKLSNLLSRLSPGNIQEIIVATNPDVEGEATALYLAQLIKPLAVKVSRIALGLPMGANLEYADEITITRALEHRTAL
jgi:recombination protein RecR